MKSFFWTLLFYFACLHLLAQEPFHVVIDKQKGLPSNSVYCIFEDKQGFIWMAHDEGLSRYDGFEFVHFTNDQQSSRSGSNIQQDKYGRIWYENFDGYLYYVEKGKLKALKQNIPTGFLEYGLVGDYLFVFQKRGIDVYALKSLRRIKTIPLDVMTVSRSRKVNDGFYFILERELFVLDEKLLVRSVQKKMKKVNQAGFVSEAENGFFTCHQSGDTLRSYYVDVNQGIHEIPLKIAGFVQNLNQTPGRLWYATTKGAYAVQKTKNGFGSAKSYFEQYSVSSVIQDVEGNLWLSTTDNGVLFVPDLESRTYLKDYKLTKLACVQNSFFVGTTKAEVFQVKSVQESLESKSFIDIYRKDDKHQVLTLASDEKRNLLFIGASLFQIRDLNNGVYFENTLALKDIVKIDEACYAFAATGLSGILTKGDVTPPFSVISSRVFSGDYKLHSLMENVRGKAVCYREEYRDLFFATNMGLFHMIKGKSEQLFWKGQTVYAKNLYAFGERVFVLTTNGRLLYLNQQNKLTNYQPSEQKKLGRISKIKLLDGTLFVLSGKDLYAIKLNEKLEKWHKIEVFSQEINDLILVGNKLVFTSAKGLVIQTLHESAKRYQARFRLNKLLVNDREKRFDENIQLNANQNKIEITYSILAFKSNFSYPLYYRINGDRWKLTSATSRSLMLASLAPGSYKIEFKFDDGDILSDKILFTIDRPFYLKTWFILVVFVLLSLLFYSIYQRRVAILNQKNQALSERILLEKQVSESILKSIKAQMNPHFFYNALNTIQSFIYADDKTSASQYLSKFSKLTRMILEMSEKEKISLREELEALNLYLDIEQTRFGSDLQIEISLNEKLDLDLIRIPSMLVQPYVENALKHGLLHSLGKKSLKLNFDKLENSVLEISIDDNGIGRQRSKEINRKKNEKHRSFAVEANYKRMEILNRGKSHSEMSVEYIDKNDGEGQALGTTVVLRIPY